MAGAEHAVEAAANLKGWQRYFNSVTIAGRRNVSIFFDKQQFRAPKPKFVFIFVDWRMKSCPFPRKKHEMRNLLGDVLTSTFFTKFCLLCCIHSVPL